MTTRIIGNDETHFNAFTRKNPTAFAGFASFDAMVDFVEAMPRPSGNGSRDAGWQTGGTRDKFCASTSMQHAIRIARDGWPEGSDMVRRVAELITTEHAVNRKRVYSVAGGRANVARMLAGNPAHMRSRPKQEARKVITLHVELSASAAIEPRNLMIRAATVTAICDVLEQAGHGCNIVAVMTSALYGRSFQVAVEIKTAGEPLNVDNVAFALGHPSMLRRFCFALAAYPDELCGFWDSMGRPEDTLEDGDEAANSYYFKRLDMSDQDKVRGSTLEERARSLIPLVLPYNLELTERE